VARVIRFEVPGVVPSKSNYRFSRTRKGLEGWRRIKNYEAEVGKSAMVAGARYRQQPLPISLTVMLVNQPVDLDNALKCPIDGLKGVVIPNDTPEWIPELHIHFENGGGEPSMKYEIRYLEE
jgi:hypothetical protein